MRIQKKIAFFLLILGAILMLELIHIIKLENKRTQTVLERQFQDKCAAVQKIILSEAESLGKITAAFSRQMERESSLRSWTSGSGVEQLEFFMLLDRVDALWIFRADFSPAYFHKLSGYSLLLPADFTPTKMAQILAGNFFRHFFLSGGKDTIEVQTWPVWGDGKKKLEGQPWGYVFTVRVWNAPYLERIANLANARISLVFPESGDTGKGVKKPAFAVRFSKPLYHWDGKTVALLQVDFNYLAPEFVTTDNRRVVILFGSFGLLILISLFFFFFTWIIKPLRILTRSLDEQDSTIIKNLMKQKNEFGYLSQLIFRFFRQKEELLQEIHDRKKMEQNLKVKEEKYRNLIENQGEGVVVLDAHEYFLFSNPAAEKMFGIFPERLIGYNLSEFVNNEQFQIIQEQTRIRSTGRKTSYEIEITRPDGEKRWIFVNATPQFEPDGSLTSFEIFVDISDRKGAESALMESEAKFRKLTEAIPSGIFILQKEKFRYVNSYLEYLTGFKREEFLRMHYLDLVHPDFRQIAADLSQQLRKSGVTDKAPVRLEMKILTREGRELWVDYTVAMIEFFKEKAILGSIYDITDRKRMEVEIIKTQKMESVAQLAGGIAHDFNNYLTAILGNISLARVMVEKQPDLVKILNKAENATVRARDLSQQLLTFSRGGDPVKEVMDLGPLVEETAGFVLSGSRVKANVSIEQDLWPVEIDESQISQVFNNLIINAVEAMPNGGTIDIRVENEKFPAQSVFSDVEASAYDDSGGKANPRRYVKITLKDYGKGIDQKDLPKIFDPYFTTKKGGIGLGLAVVYSIISKHGGSVHVQSQVGTGTTFFIWLPAADIRVQKETGPQKELFKGKGRILLMDDEDFIREVGTELLQYLGYEVGVACNGEEAVGMYRDAMENNQAFTAVIMDLTIPGRMGGKETITRLLEIDPNVKAIVSSGYSNDPVMADFRSFGFKGIVVKPYKIETLSEVLKSVIQEGESQ